MYAESSFRMKPWSQRTVRLRLPRGVKAGQSVLVTRLADHPHRTAARVAEGLYTTASDYVEVPIVNPSLIAETYVSDGEPLAQLSISPEALSPDAMADLSLEELLEALTFGDKVTQEQIDSAQPQLAARLHYWSRKRIGRLHGVRHRIHTPKVDAGHEQPAYTQARRLPPEQYEAAREEFEKLMAQGLLTPAPASPWGSPVVMVKKPKGDGQGGVAWRMAIDFRRLNAQSMLERYPLPSPNDALAALGEADWFSALDASSAFHQIEMDEESKIKTTVNFPWGQYYYETMPFGLQGATATYQRMVDCVLSGLIWSPGAKGACCICYVDDLLVFSKGSFEQHMEVLFEVLDRACGSGWVLKPSKCFIAMAECEFVGHIVCGGGTKMVRPKVDAMLQICPDNIIKTREQAMKFVNTTLGSSQAFP